MRRTAIGTSLMHQVTHSNLAVVINATDLATGTAFRFGSESSASSVHGRVLDDIPAAEAVAASAAFPLLLPAIERTYRFSAHGGETRTAGVLLTDGGVYDNLGLSVLEPGRDPRFTHHVYDVDYIISIDAGRGRATLVTPHFLAHRLHRSQDIIHRRSQDAARGRLHEAAASGKISGFVHAYLGMNDTKLPMPLSDLVPHEVVAKCPTNFRALPEELLSALTCRGEQLTRVLLDHYQPRL